MGAEQSRPRTDLKLCPFCAEEIRVNAVKCKHCGEFLNRTPTTTPEAPARIVCPQCGSTQLSANRKGFGVGKALVGGVLTGGIGLLGGFIGSRKVTITCLACGHRFNPGNTPSVELGNKVDDKTVRWVFIGVLIVIILAVVYRFMSGA